MTHFVPANLPLSVAALRVPVEWEIEPVVRRTRVVDAWFKPLLGGSFEVGTYNIWEARRDFFRLRFDDHEEVKNFLAFVGLFDTFEIDNLAAANEAKSWGRKLLLPDWSKLERTWFEYERHFFGIVPPQPVAASQLLRLQQFATTQLEKPEPKTVCSSYEFRLRFPFKEPYAILTAYTFVDALLVSLNIDQIRKAKISKCKRPDCAVVFAAGSGHKRKYCSWHCGHIEAVRRQRRKDKRGQKR